MQKEVGKLNIGVLSLQGAFIEHIQILKQLGVKTSEVRVIDDLKNLDGLIIPGGESTTMNLLLDKLGPALNQLPVFGTCAGAILLAQQNLIEMEVERNAYGSQLESFEDDFDFEKKKFHGIFIRAPKIKKVSSKVEVLARNSKNEIVLVRQNYYLASTFHPELTNDTRIHEYFIKMIIQNS